MKPIIGITTMHEIEIEKSFTLESNNYLRAVEAAGGVPLFLPITEELEDIKSYLNIIDGIVFTGGGDISPLKYGENPLQIEFSINNLRDNFEFNLFLEAYNMDMPILGICRGAQLINVALGGSLYQDINLQFSNCHGHMQSELQVYDFFHQVIIDKDSKLFDIFKSRELEVNSFHKQAIKALGDNLKVTATAKDGIIEGIEGISRKFLVGVQWHPEDLSLKHKDFVKLFKALIDNV